MRIFEVGGCVRDELLGLEPKDRDFVVVGATPEQMLAEGFKQVGADFPVFLHPETGEEFALARTERKTGVGHKGFTTDFDAGVTLEEDLRRRDLTINAMARCPITDKIVDPFNGRKDLKNHVLRHVSEAFAEDPLRVLRVARFMARLGASWRIAPETIKLMTEMVAVGELDHLTPERVWSEVARAVGEKEPMMFFATLSAVGALNRLMPEIVTSLQNVDKEFQTNPIELFGLWFAPAAINADARMAVLLMLVEREESDAFFMRFKAPTHLMDLTNMLRKTVEFVATVRGHLKPASTLLFFEENDLFRKRDLFKQALSITNAMSHRMVTTTASLLVLFEEVSKIGFADLSPDEQATLKGPDIGKAISRERKAVIDRMLMRT